LEVGIPAAAEHDLAERRLAFQAAERGLFLRYGVEPATTWLGLPDPALRIRVLEAGEGPPLVLVHGGAGGFAGLWAPLMGAMEGVTTLAVDRPGHGLSYGFEYGAVDVRRHAVQFLESVLDGLGLAEAALAGNSMGGLWCLWMAMERPERVSCVTLLGAPAFVLDTASKLHLMIKLRRLFMRKPPDLAQTRRLLERVAGKEAVGQAPPELIEAAYRVEALPEHRLGSLSLLEHAVRLGQAVPTLRLHEPDLSAVSRPVLMVWGDRDLFGEQGTGRRAARAMSDARMLEIAAGHLPWLDEPDLCARAVAAFVREHARA
jgi:pimeloyl-ACP methyl ester carboxylesterase